jgi:putative ABC transport system permease protein
MVVGRNFSPSFTNEENNLIFNETATKWIGFESPQQALNQKVSYWGEIYTIIGVLKDYHQQSLKEAFEPHIFRFMPYGRGNRGNFVFKLNSDQLTETVNLIKAKYEVFFPGNPFDYFFLNDYYDQQYKSEEMIGSVFGIFSFFAIFVTSLGILGLSSFIAVQRTKEIGIRKVLGANVSKIIILLSRDFILLIILSFMITLPLTILGINYWLESFANKMDIDLSIYVWPLLIVCLITIITMLAHVIKSALTNPVESLRYE